MLVWSFNADLCITCYFVSYVLDAGFQRFYSPNTSNADDRRDIPRRSQKEFITVFRSSSADISELLSSVVSRILVTETDDPADRVSRKILLTDK